MISADQDWSERISDMEPERKEMGTARQKPVVSVCMACEYRHDRRLRGIKQPCWTKRLVLGTVFKGWRWTPGVKAGVNEIWDPALGWKELDKEISRKGKSRFVTTVKDFTFLQMGNVLVKCFIPIYYCCTQEFMIWRSAVYSCLYHSITVNGRQSHLIKLSPDGHWFSLWVSNFWVPCFLLLHLQTSWGV